LRGEKEETRIFKYMGNLFVVHSAFSPIIELLFVLSSKGDVEKER